MASKRDRHVNPLGGLEKLADALGAEADRAVWRFTDDNDGAQYAFGFFVRVLPTRADAEALAARTGQRYMGRKRHVWKLVLTDISKGV